MAQDVLARAAWRLHLVGAAAGGRSGVGVPFDAAAPGAEAPREGSSPGHDACHHDGPRPGERAPTGGGAAAREHPTAAWNAALAEGISARVPGTVTGALRDALGEQAVDRVLEAAGPDAVWEYRTRVSTAGGPHRFTSTGVATVTRLLVAGHEVHACDTAFLPWDVTVELPPGPCEIVLRLLPLTAVPVPRKPRARWLSPLVPDRSLRWRRTPLVGAIDWPGARPVLGPWGGLSARPEPPHPESAPRDPASHSLAPHDLAASAGQEVASDDAAAPGPRPGEPVAVRTRVAENGDGVVTVRCAVDHLLRGAAPEVGEGSEPARAPLLGEAPVRVRIEITRIHLGTGAQGSSRPAAPCEHGPWDGNCEPVEDTIVWDRTVSTAEAPGSGFLTVELAVPRPELWWPHGMGEQALYRVQVRLGESEHAVTVGFRTVEAEPRSAEHRGLALTINRVPLFVRGAVWSGADPFETAAPVERLRTVLSRLRDAGTTVVRLPGTGCYETGDFHRVCDELGLMVWQDVALGPLDPPDEPDWRAGVRRDDED